MSAAGIPLALAATTAYSVGLILEKRALGHMPELDVRRTWRMVIGLASTPAWLVGFALMLTGLACQTVVLTFEPVSVVQPVLSSGVALVLVLSRLVLRERLGGGEFWCVAAVAGSVVLLAFSATGSSSATGHHASPALLAAVAVPSVAVGLLVSIGALRGRNRKHRAPAAGIGFGLGTGLLYGIATLFNKALSGALVHDHSAADLVVRVLSSPYLYLFGGCTIVAMLFYQAALQACRASIVIPVNSIASSLYFMIAGTLLFHEQLPSSPVKLTLRLTAIAVTGAGLVVLSRQVSREAPARQLAGQLVDGQPGSADNHDGAGQPRSGRLPQPVRVVNHEPYPGRSQHRG
jgi:drug/metabolite transporter (DMT)-like permease